MLHILIRSGTPREIVSEFLTAINNLDCKKDFQTLEDDTTDILLIEDYLDNTKVDLNNHVNLLTIEYGLIGIVTVEDVTVLNTETITTVNYESYVTELSSKVDSVILEVFNMENEIDCGEEDYTGDLELELEDLNEIKFALSNLLTTMYEYALRLNIEV